jgi:cobyrinic acid a,c-diamide synthase
MKPSAKELATRLGFVDDEILDDLVASHPTLRSYVEGHINFTEAVFIEEFLANGYDARRAAKSAQAAASTNIAYGYLGDSMLRNKKVKRLLARRLGEKALEADMVMAKYAEIANASMADFVDVVEVEDPATGAIVNVAMPNLRKALDSGKLHLAKELKYSKDGDVVIKLRDAEKALDQIARHLGLFEADNVQRIPPEIAALVQLSPEEKRQKLQEYKSMMEGPDADAESPAEG